MFHEGLTAGEMASRLGGDVTRSAVLGKLHRLELKRDDNRAIRILRTKHGIAAASKRPRAARRARFVPPYVGEPKVPATNPDPLPDPSEAYRCEIMDLTNDKCRWIVSTGYPAVFCGAPGCDVDRGAPYCSFHWQIAYQPPRSRVAEPSRAV
jgi:GcrA cell cycle regulator